MKKKICILTATRAEYDLLRPVIIELNHMSDLDVRVVVTGAHLSPEFGLTYKEIEKDGISIDHKIEILLSSDTPSSISKSMGLALIGFADYFDRIKPDLLLVLGDRYETLAVCCAAMNQRIPIAHLYGGETTEGAIDECIRHSITKMSLLHFTSTEQYRKRIIQLGEHPDRVFNVGSIGVENVKSTALYDRSEISELLGIENDSRFVIVTFHPVTLENASSEYQIKELFNAFDLHKNLTFVFTKGNADAGGRVINQLIDEYVAVNKNCRVFTSLGLKLYLSAVKNSICVIGNSSSGIVEVPSFGIPTINIGDRQKGRIQADSIINCKPSCASIDDAINLALNPGFRDKACKSVNPYAKPDTTNRIVFEINRALQYGLNLKKQFYDI